MLWLHSRALRFAVFGDITRAYGRLLLRLLASCWRCHDFSCCGLSVRVASFFGMLPVGSIILY